MRLNIRVRGGGNWFSEIFKRGVERHGDTAVVNDLASAPDGDMEVVWSERHMRSKPTLVAEAGYVNAKRLTHQSMDCFGGSYPHDRCHYVAFGFNGQHGHADPLPGGLGADRAMKHGLFVPGVREPTGEGDVVLFGQADGDYNVKHLNYPEELRGLAVALVMEYGDRVKFRPHPLGSPKVNPLLKRCRGPLSDVLAKADLAVTVNSNAAVDAQRAGVATLVTDPFSVAYPVSSHIVGHPLFLDDAARIMWGIDLAWRQWTQEEILTGEAWEFLRAVYEEQQ